MTFTAKLQKQFPEVYKQLFPHYEFVLSGHFGFHRFPAGIVHTDSYVAIKQKAESKCYIGFRKTSTPKIEIEDILMYDGQDFISYGRESLDKHYQNSLHILEEKFDIADKNYGYQIFVLAESTRGEGLGFTGTMFSQIVLGIGILSGKYASSLLDDYQKFQRSQTFHEIKTIAHQCTLDTKKGNIGSHFYTTMLETSHPHVYLSESHNISNTDHIGEIKEYYQTLPEMLHIDEPIFNTIPVRRAIIYTGQRSNTLMVENQKQLIENQNNKYSERFCNQNWDGIHSHLHDIFSKHSYYELMKENMSSMSAKTLYLFSHIYKFGPNKEYINELINHLNTVHTMYNDLEGDTSFKDDFDTSCVNSKISPNVFGLSPVYTTKFGGNYIVVFDEESDFHILENIVEQMKNNYPHIRIAHKYNFDNPPYQGIKIEQNIYQNMSKTDGDNYLLLDNLGNQKFCQYTDIDPSSTTGLFLDAIKGKVYLDGKPLTSKDIKSQTTTIEIFDLILQSPDFTIKNNQLGPSSFSGQQNQMLGKIISPLVKLVKLETGKDLNLECTGSLREFYLKLGKTDTPVVLVKKI